MLSDVVYWYDENLTDVLYHMLLWKCYVNEPLKLQLEYIVNFNTYDWEDHFKMYRM